jgi:repressor of nif and glnA expression
MPKTKQDDEIPELSDERLQFLRLYRDLERRLGGAPTQSELAAEHGGYAEGSERAAVQYMLRTLEEMGLIGPLVKRPPPRITELGLAVLRKNRRRL